MTSIAIIMGNSVYNNGIDLPCCKADVAIVRELLEATGRYDPLFVFENSKSTPLKDELRASLAKFTSIDEIVFYFSGHGFHNGKDFFFCTTDFDPKIPNETGLANSDLDVWLRACDATTTVVKIVDACYSGNSLIKNPVSIFEGAKGAFRNYIQFSSCLSDQESLTGDPISLFTEKFIAAALKKPEGIVYYSDIISVLKDEFLDHPSQTPHFVLQGTGAEIFVHDACVFNAIRGQRATLPSPPTSVQANGILEERDAPLEELLKLAEQKSGNLDTVKNFIQGLFLSVQAGVDVGALSKFYNLTASVFPTYSNVDEEYMCKVLLRQNRVDNFVEASQGRSKRRRYLWEMPGLYADDYEQYYHIKLNSNLEKAQIRLDLTPKYYNIKRIVLNVACAPSLEKCYIFEFVTLHPLKDWGVYETEGSDISQRWLEATWSDDTKPLGFRIASKLNDAVRDHLENAEKRLREARGPTLPKSLSAHADACQFGRRVQLACNSHSQSECSNR